MAISEDVKAGFLETRVNNHRANALAVAEDMMGDLARLANDLRSGKETHGGGRFAARMADLDRSLIIVAELTEALKILKA